MTTENEEKIKMPMFDIKPISISIMPNSIGLPIKLAIMKIKPMIFKSDPLSRTIKTCFIISKRNLNPPIDLNLAVFVNFETSNICFNKPGYYLLGWNLPDALGFYAVFPEDPEVNSMSNIFTINNKAYDINHFSQYLKTIFLTKETRDKLCPKN